MHSVSAGIAVAVWLIVFTCLTTLVLGLRAWAAWSAHKGIKIQDYLVVVAYVSTLAQTAVAGWAIAHGLGDYTDRLTTYELGVQWKLATTATVTWLVATVACKLSILTLYLTLFRISKRFSISIYVTCACVVIYFVVYLPVQLTQCHPIDYGWNPVPGGGCRSSRATQISSIALNIVIDTVIAVLPITILWNLRMPLRTKIAIGTMFSLGLFVVAILCWRLAQNIRQSATEQDWVRALPSQCVAGFLELWGSIIVVSLPTLAPLFRRYVEPRLPRRRSADDGAHIHLREAQHTVGSEPRKKRVGSADLVDSLQGTVSETEVGSTSNDRTKVSSEWDRIVPTMTLASEETQIAVSRRDAV